MPALLLLEGFKDFMHKEATLVKIKAFKNYYKHEREIFKQIFSESRSLEKKKNCSSFFSDV